MGKAINNAQWLQQIALKLKLSTTWSSFGRMGQGKTMIRYGSDNDGECCPVSLSITFINVIINAILVQYVGDLVTHTLITDHLSLTDPHFDFWR